MWSLDFRQKYKLYAATIIIEGLGLIIVGRYS